MARPSKHESSKEEKGPTRGFSNPVELYMMGL